jgi:hypothetical protein
METRNPRQKYDGCLKERNLQAVKNYYTSNRDEILKQLVLRRMRNGHQPKPSTLAKYGIK